MKKINIILITLLFVSNSFLYSQNRDSIQISHVIKKSYIEGLINGKDFNEARKGMHKDFLIFGHKKDSLTLKSIDKWITQREKRKNLPDVKYKIEFIDIEKDAATAKIEMYRNKIKAVDYVFLYKFNSGWKIVSAIDDISQID